MAAKCVTSNSQAICLIQQQTEVPGEDNGYTETTLKAVTESLQRAGRCLCASAEAKQHPQLSKPAGSRNAVHLRRQHRESSEHREHSPRENSRLCNITRQSYKFSSCDEVLIGTRDLDGGNTNASQRRPGAGSRNTLPLVWSTAFRAELPSSRNNR